MGQKLWKLTPLVTTELSLIQTLYTVYYLFDNKTVHKGNKPLVTVWYNNLLGHKLPLKLEFIR